MPFFPSTQKCFVMSSPKPDRHLIPKTFIILHKPMILAEIGEMGKICAENDKVDKINR